jgi:hypothetical protein
VPALRLKGEPAMADAFFGLESKGEALASQMRFLGRLAASLCMASVVIAVSLFAGMLGYHHFESMSWTDAYVNAAMILSGMGPVGQLNTEAGKIFAGSYALYSGLVIIIATGIVLAPVVHRVLHRFHLDEDDEKG